MSETASIPQSETETDISIRRLDSNLSEEDRQANEGREFNQDRALSMAYASKQNGESAVKHSNEALQAAENTHSRDTVRHLLGQAAKYRAAANADADLAGLAYDHANAHKNGTTPPPPSGPSGPPSGP